MSRFSAVEAARRPDTSFPFGEDVFAGAVQREWLSDDVSERLQARSSRATLSISSSPMKSPAR